MAGRKSKKHEIIEISSSTSTSTSTSEQSEYIEENEEDDSEEISSSSCGNGSFDSNDWINSENEELGYPHVDKDDEASSHDKVFQFLPGKIDIGKLKLVECKVYLRRHGLRLSGTKEECIERIKEHLRIKDGNGEALYPRSSFKINCTGDVCKGDVVLFSQNVYESFEKKKRCGGLLGRRTVVGKIVKESYGTAKQQHTFTVEVLWSKGMKKLAPLSPLLVKGRNLYKMRTYRQHWENERDRLEVLAEKHRRGAAARSLRDIRRTIAKSNTNKSFSHNENESHKHKHETEAKKRNNVKKSDRNQHGTSLVGINKQIPNQNFHPLPVQTSKQRRDLAVFHSHGRQQDRFIYHLGRQDSNFQTNNYTINSGFTKRTASSYNHSPDSKRRYPESNLTPVSESLGLRACSTENANPHLNHASELRTIYEFPGRRNMYPAYYHPASHTYRLR